jgi:hypothetical protein
METLPVRTKTRKVDDLCPDGVRIVVDWESMVVGASIFVPCINTKKATQQIKAYFKQQGWSSEVRTLSENGLLGVRAWRTT